MPARYRIVLSPRGAAELQAIFDYIAAQSPQNAPRVVERILDAVQSLELMPARFKVARRSRKHGYVVYSMVVPPHVVYYRIMEADQVVRVLTVQHGARRRPRDFE
jgi:toxin ParE1/3/4